MKTARDAMPVTHLTSLAFRSLIASTAPLMAAARGASLVSRLTTLVSTPITVAR